MAIQIKESEENAASEMVFMPYALIVARLADNPNFEQLSREFIPPIK
jgi:hypothetical protein